MINRIICGDSLTELKKIESNSIDLILTSPPYFGQRNYTENEALEIGKEKNFIDYENKLEEIFVQCIRICKFTGNIVFNK